MTRPLQAKGVGTAFFAGCLLTWLCMTLLRRFEGSSRELLQSNSMEGRFERLGPPERLGLSPLAVQAEPGSMGNATLDRLIVAVRHREDTSWLDVYLSDIPHVVYQNADPKDTDGAQHATVMNKGTEAMGYLQFIIDYFDRLPASIAFIHGGRSAWHLRDHVPLLRRMRWGAVPFANLRFRNGPHNRLPWLCGQQTNDTGWQGFDCNWVGNFLYPTSMRPRPAKRIHDMNKDEWFDSLTLAQTWDQNFGPWLGPLPPVVRSPCCGEFVVSRERIVRHPRAFYVHLREWIVATEMDWTTSGRVFEHMWPQIFGEAAVIDPVEECVLLTCNATEAILAAAPTPADKMHYITTSNSAEDAQWTEGVLPASAS